MALSQGDLWGGNDPEVQDETNYRADYGPINQNRTHSFTFDSVYTLPADRWLNAGSVLKQVVGGWQLAGILGVANGAWLNVVQPSTFLNSRPDVNGANPYTEREQSIPLFEPGSIYNNPNRSQWRSHPARQSQQECFSGARILEPGSFDLQRLQVPRTLRSKVPRRHV